MRALINRFRTKAQRVKYMRHLVPSDHEEMAENYQVFWFFVAWFIGVAPVLYLFRNVPVEDNAVITIPVWAVTAAAWGISHLLYIQRMDRLITKFVPGSFTLPVAPTTF